MSKKQKKSEMLTKMKTHTYTHTHTHACTQDKDDSISKLHVYTHTHTKPIHSHPLLHTHTTQSIFSLNGQSINFIKEDGGRSRESTDTESNFPF